MTRSLRIELATPCAANWEEMVGDERVRFCALCQKHVYAISGLSAAEVEALVTRPGQAPCVRFFQRSDGTVLTSDCPVGLAERARRLAWAARARWGALVALVLAVLGLGAWSDREAPPALAPLALAPPPPTPSGPPEVTPPPIPSLPARPRTGFAEPFRTAMGRMQTIQVQVSTPHRKGQP